MDFVTKASQLSVEKYTMAQKKMDPVPSCCFISLDLVNMFNEISWDQVFEIIEAKYPKLLPLVSVL